MKIPGHGHTPAHAWDGSKLLHWCWFLLYLDQRVGQNQNFGQIIRKLIWLLYVSIILLITMIIQVSNLHCNQRLVLLLNLLLGEYFQIMRFLIKHWYHKTKQAIKKTTKIRKWKWRCWTVVVFAKNVQIGAFHPAKEGWSPTTNPQHRDGKLAAGHYLGAVSVLRKSLPPWTDPSC